MSCAPSWPSPGASSPSARERSSPSDLRRRSPVIPGSSRHTWAMPTRRLGPRGRAGLSMLEVEGLAAGYGDLLAVRSVSLSVQAGECVALVGANGAGKTTTLRALSGLIPIRAGRAVFQGHSLSGLASRDVVALGLAHVPEGRQVFTALSVRENLEMGAQAPMARSVRGESLAQVFALFPRLREREGQAAGTLSGGEQQMLAIGRGLMA